MSISLPFSACDTGVARGRTPSGCTQVFFDASLSDTSGFSLTAPSSDALSQPRIPGDTEAATAPASPLAPVLSWNVLKVDITGVPPLTGIWTFAGCPLE